MDDLRRVFGVSDADLLGEGIESQVYALDAGRVLRLPRAPKRDEWEQRAQFLARIGGFPLPFAVPTLLDAGWHGDRGFTIEKRLPGRALMAALADPDFRGRDAALDALCRVPDALESADLSESPYGELLGADRVNTTRWSDFLAQKVARELARSEVGLRRHVPHLDQVLAEFAMRLDALSDPPKRLVHGDLYPGNVLVDDDGRITALIDFSRLTVVGDTDLDRTGALAFLTPFMSAPVRDDERAALAEALAARRGALWPETRRTYQIYYALLFSDCETFDPPTYAWLLGVLKDAITHR